MVRQIIGVLVTVFLFSTLLVVNVAQTLSLIILPFSKGLFRRFNRACAQFYWGLCVVVWEKVLGLKVIITGDNVPAKENTIVVANHQNMSDIVALWMLAWRKQRLGDMKWYIKRAMKYFPGIGWGAWFLDCLFVKRDWHADKRGIKETFSRLINDQIPFWIISFSEGTRFTLPKLRKSQEYARALGVPPPQHTLIPRTKGFVASVEGLRDHVDAIYDVTIGYPNEVPTLWAFIQPRARELHLHVRRFAMKDLPTGGEDLAKWLLARFQEKDRLLAYFRTRGDFSNAAV